VTESDRVWGAENTYRVEMLIALAADQSNSVRSGVARNAQATAEIRDRILGLNPTETMSASGSAEAE
jgi:hypothetical protein